MNKNICYQVLIGGAVPDCNRCASPPMLIGLLMGGCARGLLIYQVSSLERGDAHCCAPAETISKES